MDLATVDMKIPVVEGPDTLGWSEPPSEARCNDPNAGPDSKPPGAATSVYLLDHEKGRDGIRRFLPISARALVTALTPGLNIDAWSEELH